MMWDKLHSYMQIVGATLAIPAAAAGTYTAYRTYFSLDVACGNLHGAILGVMEKNIAPETKSSLLRRDVAHFEKMCGKADPESLMSFQAGLDPPHAPANAPPAAAALASSVQTAAAGPPQSVVESKRPSDDGFGLSRSGERHG